MRVMVLVKATKSSEAGEMPGEQLMADMGKFNEELVKAGIMRAGEGLKPSSEGARVRFSGEDRSVMDGPFMETNELVAGFWLWEVDSMEQAVEWVKRCPNPMLEDSDIEIRPLYEWEDFAASDPQGKWRDHEAGLRDAIAMGESTTQPYLFFGGRCEEALDHYQRVLHAKRGMLMRWSQSPDPLPEGMLAEGFEDKVMHADFTVGSARIMASDGCGETTRFEGFRLALSVSGEALARRLFDALAEGGQVDMPLTKTFWSPCYGMVTDKFGVGWMVMVPGPEQQGCD